jgi:hypothetical protein
MLFLRIKNIVLKSLAYARKYWYIIAGVLASIVVGALTFGRHVTSVASIFQQIESDHIDEIAKINAAHEAAGAARAANEAARQKTLDDIKKQYVADVAAVDAKQRADVDRMVREQGDDPNKVAEDLGKTLGVAVIKRQDD